MPVEKARTVNLRLLLAGAAFVSAVAVVWAATALAGGSGSSPASEPAGTKPAASYVEQKSRSESKSGQRGDCPERHRADATMPADL
jgi:hypothetical protein